MFFRISFLKNLAIFTGKNLCWSIFLMCFPVNIAKFLRTAFLKKHLWWLLLSLKDPELSLHYFKTLTEKTNKSQRTNKTFRTTIWCREKYNFEWCTRKQPPFEFPEDTSKLIESKPIRKSLIVILMYLKNKETMF